MATGSTYAVDLLNQDGTNIVRAAQLQFQSATNQPATAPNTLYIRQFPFGFGTAGLTTGVTLFTPAIGDLIYDVGISVTTLFNGTTPKADVGTFSGGNVGLFGELANSGQVSLGTADVAVTDNAGLTTTNGNQWLNDAVASVASAGTAAFKPPILSVTVANPFLLVVSQTGQKSGTATGASAGVGVVYVITGTPA